MNKLIPVVLFSLLLGLSACAVVPPPQSVNGIPLQPVARLDDTDLFAVDPAGEMVVIASDRLILLNLESKASLELSASQSSALAWSPDGAILAAAFPSGDNKTRILLFSRQGNLTREILLPVNLSRLEWSVRGDLLATGYALKTYSFGANLRQVFYRLNENEPAETTLSDTTLKPSTARQLTRDIANLQPIVFSRYGDEVVYLRLHDPPEFPAYLALVTLNWQGGAPRILHEFPVQKVEILRDQEDSVELVLNGQRQTVPLWPNVAVTHDQEPVYRFTEGRLYENEKLLADWGKKSSLQIMADGRYFLASDGTLYMGSGLHVRPDEVYSEKKWSLRRWRAAGLISQSEYRELLREGKQ